MFFYIFEKMAARNRTIFCLSIISTYNWSWSLAFGSAPAPTFLQKNSGSQNIFYIHTLSKYLLYRLMTK